MMCAAVLLSLFLNCLTPEVLNDSRVKSNLGASLYLMRRTRIGFAIAIFSPVGAGVSGEEKPPSRSPCDVTGHGASVSPDDL